MSHGWKYYPIAKFVSRLIILIYETKYYFFHSKLNKILVYVKENIFQAFLLMYY